MALTLLFSVSAQAYAPSVEAEVILTYHRAPKDDGFFGDLEMGTSSGEIVEVAPGAGELRLGDERVPVNLGQIAYSGPMGLGVLEVSTGTRVILKNDDVLKIAGLSNTRKLRRAKWKSKVRAMIERCRTVPGLCKFSRPHPSLGNFLFEDSAVLEFYRRKGMVLTQTYLEDSITILDRETKESLLVTFAVDDITVQ